MCKTSLSGRRFRTSRIRLSIRRGSTGFPSLLRLAPCQTEEDGWTDVCGWQEGERKTPTAVLIIPDEKVLVVISLSQQVLESPNDIMREDLDSCWSCRSGFTFEISIPKGLVPRKIVAVLPSIQGNLLWRETTEARVKLLNSHAIRPEGGHAHGGDLLSKVVVVQRLKTYKPIGKEVPNLIRRGATEAVHYVILDHKVLGKVRSSSERAMGQTSSQAALEVDNVGTSSGTYHARMIKAMSGVATSDNRVIRLWRREIRQVGHHADDIRIWKPCKIHVSHHFRRWSSSVKYHTYQSCKE